MVDDIADDIAVNGPDSDDRDCIDDPIIPVRRRFRVLRVLSEHPIRVRGHTFTSMRIWVTP